jgi:SWIM zinc finger
MNASASRIFELAKAWKQKHPDLTDRIDRAIALTGGVERVGEGVFEVEGRTATYIVRVRGADSSCTCPDDHRYRRQASHCKHRLAVALVVRAETSEKAS